MILGKKILHQVQGKERTHGIKVNDIAEPEGIQKLSKKELVRLLHSNGLKPKEISENTGIPLSTVYKFIRKKKKTGPKPFKKRNDEIIKRISRGESQAQLGREYGISRQRVNAIYWRAAKTPSS